MKGHTLRYRIPGDTPVTKKGRFHSISSLNTAGGFIVSTFNKEHVYAFEEEELESEIHLGEFSDFDQFKSDRMYRDAGYFFLDALKKQELDKIILSRRHSVKMEIDPNKLFIKLCECYPEAFTYLISSPVFGTWLGASPELMLQSDGDNYLTIALAGTKRVKDTFAWSEKELEEHRYVSDYIMSNLNAIGAANIQVNGPYDSNAGPVKHLKTDFRFNGLSGSETFLDLMHPTPAVAGIPKEKAIRTILEHEGYDRELYAGLIGVKGGKTNVFVNLRCMQLFKNECLLYVGGGWTAESDPDSEFTETENKAGTLLQVLEMQ